MDDGSVLIYAGRKIYLGAEVALIKKSA